MDNYNPNRSMEMELNLRRAIDALREDYEDHSDYTGTISGMLGDNDVNDPEATSIMLEGISNVVELIKDERSDDDPLVKGVEKAVTEWGNYLGGTFEDMMDKNTLKTFAANTLTDIYGTQVTLMSQTFMVDSINDTENMDKVKDTLDSLIERQRKAYGTLEREYDAMWETDNGDHRLTATVNNIGCALREFTEHVLSGLSDAWHTAYGDEKIFRGSEPDDVDIFEPNDTQRRMAMVAAAYETAYSLYDEITELDGKITRHLKYCFKDK